MLLRLPVRALPPPPPPPPPPKKKYADEVDKMIFEFKERNNCLINIEKTGPNFYIFGTKKIYAKVMNGVLLVRVGGGFMDIDHFYMMYGETEYQKQLKLGGSPPKD